MIISDDTPDSPAKGAAPLPPPEDDHGVGGADARAPPPAYTQYAASAPYVGSSSSAPGPGPAAPLLDPERQVRRAHRRASMRFWKAMALAFGVWILLSALTGSVLDFTFARRRWVRPFPDERPPDSYPRPSYTSTVSIPHSTYTTDAPVPRPTNPDRSDPPRDDPPQLPPGHPRMPDAEDGRVIHCAGGVQHWLPSPQAMSFDLPLSSDVLYLFARGTAAHGALFLEQDTHDNPEHPYTVHVDVSVLSGADDVLDRTNVCLLERTSGEVGVGILAPDSNFVRDRLQLIISVRFPHSHSQVRAPAFETQLPNFAQHVGDLGARVLFSALSLNATNARISAETVFAYRADIRTTNGAIQGNFGASDNLMLITTNSPIQAQVWLGHDGIREGSTELLMQTTNSALSAIMTLEAARDGGAYNVTATTTNGPLTLRFPRSPMEAELDVRAETRNDKALVSLNRAFEGAFELRTTNSRPRVEHDEDAEDPAGKDRERVVRKFARGAALDGSVVWGEEPPHYRVGSVRVSTTNAPVVLDLQ